MRSLRNWRSSPPTSWCRWICGTSAPYLSPKSGAMAEARRLDPTQHAAAAADAPVQLTLAGPGAGKTTTLAVRFVHLVRQGVDPRRILAVTFTRKAAIEMQDRIVRLLRLDGPKGLAVDTFHAFAFRHLRRRPQRFGLPEQFDLWDVPQQRHVFHARRMWWNEEIDIIDLIGGMKERLIDAAGFARMVGDKSDELRAYYPAPVEFFHVYEAALCHAGVFALRPADAARSRFSWVSRIFPEMAIPTEQTTPTASAPAPNQLHQKNQSSAVIGVLLRPLEASPAADGP